MPYAKVRLIDGAYCANSFSSFLRDVALELRIMTVKLECTFSAYLATKSSVSEAILAVKS